MRGRKFEVRCNGMKLPSLADFAGIRGGDSEGRKDVCFARAVGVNFTLTQEIERMDGILTERMELGQCRYVRTAAFPALPVAEIAAYTRSYEEWRNTGKQSVHIKATEGKPELSQVLGRAYGTVLQLFGRMNPKINDTIERNFAVKLLFWFDRIGGELVKQWSPQALMKAVFQNVSRKQEYLFCYLLTQIGVDVMLLQCEEDIGEGLERLKLSQKILQGKMQAYEIPAYDARRYRAEKNRPEPSGMAAEARPVVHIPERGRRKASAQAAVRNAAPPVLSSESPQGRRKRELEFEELALFASSVVMIVIHDQSGKTIGSGSGIMIGKDGYILTNHHVAAGGRFYSVRIEEDDKVYTTDEVIKYNSVLDLAILRIDRKLHPIPVYAGEKGLVRGQKVVAIGSPLGLFNSVSDGIISGFRNVDGVAMIQFTAPISHGSSGGAVLNMYGEVIGISTAGIDSGQNLNLAVGYESILPFIRGFV